MIQKLLHIGHSGQQHERTLVVKKNILALISIKGISVLNSLLLVPLSISYLNKEQYGVWLTIFSMLSWLGLLDIGLGNGLRNKFTECKARGNLHQLKVYVSTAYVLLSVIMLIVVLIFLILRQWVNWQGVLNTNSVEEHELSLTIMAVFVFFCSQLVVKLISTIFIADQKTFMSAAINTLSSILTLITVFALKNTTHSSILYMGVLVGAINVLVPLAISIYYFRKEYSYCAPSLRYVDLKGSRSLMSLGLYFFLFQSSALIVVATDNIIISRLFGPAEVTPYNVAIKYFAPLTIFFTLLSAPLWSAYTDAYEKQDIGWIRSITSKMMKVWLLLLLLFVPMWLLSPFIYKIWIGDEIQVPYYLTFWVGVYTLLASWNQIFSNFINGISKVRLGFILSLITGLINIPLCLLLADYFNMGTTGIIIASSLSLIPDLIFLPLQYRRIVSGTATGIWNR